MTIILKHFYFIKDDYYTFANDNYLMSNKENGIKRPCFLAIQDTNNIIWMIPVTSKYAKFVRIYNDKISRYGSCDTIVLGQLLGRNCAYLIQNMFPVTQKYIESMYIQSSNNIPVTIDNPTANILVQKCKTILALVRNGITGLVFPNILAIEQKLLDELNNQ